MTNNIKEQIVEELHKPARKNFTRRKVIIKKIQETFQVDLISLIPYARLNRGFKYILVTIDIFTKYVWAVPVKNKTGKTISYAMKKILLNKNAVPENLQSDR